MNIPNTLIQKIRDREVSILIGAGMSIPLNYPSWSQLIEDIYEKLEQKGFIDINNKDLKGWIDNNIKSSPEWVAEILSNLNEEEFVETLKECISKYNSTDISSLNHALIALLPFKSYITTNYDTIIEKVLEKASFNGVTVIENLVSKEENILDSTIVYKIHGGLKNKKFVITSSDYYNYLHDQIYIRFLDKILTQQAIFTIGYSLKDRDFRNFIDERYHLHKNKCKTMYVVIPEEETCNAEINTYKTKYNIILIPISSSNDFVELKKLLLNIFCLVYQVDLKFSSEIEIIVGNRFEITNRSLNDIDKSREIEEAQKVLSIFKEPIDLHTFTAICMNMGIRNLSPAHFVAFSKSYHNKIFSNSKDFKPSNENIECVSRWFLSYFESIPLGEAPKFLSIYHKRIFDQFFKTIQYLLSTPSGWNILIGNESELAQKRLERFNEFFRQEGRWKEWLLLVKYLEKNVDKDSSIYKYLAKTKAWVYFWTRQYDMVKQLIEMYPEIDEEEGQYSYRDRLKYMQLDHLCQLINDLNNKCSVDKNDYFSLSLLGRSYARLSQRQIEEESINTLKKAYKIIKQALDMTVMNADMIELSVQTWYLALIKIELNELEMAKELLAKVRMYDECIMNRVPGLAWLAVAEYRLAKKEGKDIENKKREAKKAMSNLGMINIDEYLEKDFFY